MKKILKQTAIVAAAAAIAFPSAVWASNGKDEVTGSAPLYEIRTYAGTGEIGLTDGKNHEAAFRAPSSITALPTGDLIVADTSNQRIRTVSGTTTSTRAGFDLGEDEYGFLIGGFYDGDAGSSFFNGPTGITVGSGNVLIVADSGNHAIRAVPPQGAVTTIAGNGKIGLQDGKASDAKFHYPMDAAVTADGVIYVADTLNHVIRKIENGIVTTLTAPSTRVIEFFPGIAEPAGDFADGPIGKAKFNEPSGLALDAKGNLFVSDTGNHRIRYIDFAAGTVTTVAGSAKAAYGAEEAYAEGGFADGIASGAMFRAPRGIAVTPGGGLLIADSLNHVVRYLKDGVVSTIAGTPEDSSKSDGVAAYAGLNRPTDVAWIANGSIAVTDTGNNKIRLITRYVYPERLKRIGAVQLAYNREIVPTDAAPVIKQGTTFVPMRVVADKLGYKVDYIDRKATITRGVLTYTLNQDEASVTRTENGQSTKIKLNASPFTSGGRLFLPVRFFAEEIGLDVQWLPDVKTVLLRDPLF